MRHSSAQRLALLLVSATLLPASGSPAPPKPAPESRDAAFTAVAGEYLEDIYRRQPTQATDLGIHKYDDRLEDYSREGVTAAVASARQFRDRVSLIEPASLTADKQLDREQLQFLYARNFPSDVRKVFGAATNSEGWAH